MVGYSSILTIPSHWYSVDIAWSEALQSCDYTNGLATLQNPQKKRHNKRKQSCFGQKLNQHQREVTWGKIFCRGSLHVSLLMLSSHQKRGRGQLDWIELSVRIVLHAGSFTFHHSSICHTCPSSMSHYCHTCWPEWPRCLLSSSLRQSSY